MNFHDSPLLLQHLFNIKVKNSSDQKHHMPEVHEIRVLHEEKDSFKWLLCCPPNRERPDNTTGMPAVL